MTTIDLDKTRHRWNLGIKVLLFLGLGFIVAPFIYTAIQGLIGLVVAAAVVLGVNFFVPVVADRAANLRINLIKSAAAKDPIPTLQRDYARRESALNDFKESIKTFAAAYLTFKDKLDQFKTDYPADAAKYDEMLTKMKQLLEVRKAKYVEAAASLNKYSSEIDRAKAIWDMGQEAAKMSNAAGMTNGDFMDKLRVETALDSVTMSMNTAFADLEDSLLEDKSEKSMLKLGVGSNDQVIDEKKLFKGQKVLAGKAKS